MFLKLWDVSRSCKFIKKTSTFPFVFLARFSTVPSQRFFWMSSWTTSFLKNLFLGKLGLFIFFLISCSLLQKTKADKVIFGHVVLNNDIYPQMSLTDVRHALESLLRNQWLGKTVVIITLRNELLIHEESITWKNPRQEKLESPDYLERLTQGINQSKKTFSLFIFANFRSLNCSFSFSLRFHRKPKLLTF